MSSRAKAQSPVPSASIEIRVRGRVQGVGFRPAVWRFAEQLGLSGDVRNDADGVLIRASGAASAVAALVEHVRNHPPPLARVERVETRALAEVLDGRFRIGETQAGPAATDIAPDAALCPACARDVLASADRRYRYAFATCTHCGPRLSIVEGVPYDRATTTMASFPMCGACLAEYRDPCDRRFHAQAIACPECGPQAKLVRLAADTSGVEPHLSSLDALEAVSRLLLRGHIVAVKGLGGYQLACDATDASAVMRLREAKGRDAKPFALMARDLDVVRRYCAPTAAEASELMDAAAPIVVMRAVGAEKLPEAIAPGLNTCGFMLPTTPLHLLVMQEVDRPVVMTSGNLSDEPQIIDDAAALERLGALASHALVHDRRIVSRVDDSVVRVIDGTPRVLRRARGFAPAAIPLPEGLEASPDLLAFGGELKSTFCLVKDGRAILSQHHGDLEEAETLESFHRGLARFTELFDHAPRALVADLHPEYLSSKAARERAAESALPLLAVQHHHAHVAACLVEHGRPLAAPPVLGIVLDGLGWGSDGTLWGGEFLLADYAASERLATLKPVAMLGGERAAREPWRNLYAHLMAEMTWTELAVNFGELELYKYLASKPRATLDAMLRNRFNSPRVSSCGRLFDAVAAAVGISRERQSYEGEAACRLESIVDERTVRDPDALAYPFAIPRLGGSGLPYLEPLAMWRAILGDLIMQTPAAVMAARFHMGLAGAVAAMARKLGRSAGLEHARFDTVALSGGCFQNAVLLSETVRRLTADGFRVLTHARVPANDGGLALGQAAIGAARLIAAARRR